MMRWLPALILACGACAETPMEFTLEARFQLDLKVPDPARARR